MFYMTALNIDATTIPGEFLVDFIFNSIPPGMFHMGDDISNSSKLSKTRMLDPKPRIFSQEMPLILVLVGTLYF